MNLGRLKQAEAEFLHTYPGGFADPGLETVGKRHNVGRMNELAQDAFKKSRFRQPGAVLENMVKLTGRSSMVSMFEKPKFRDYAATLATADRRLLVGGLREWLHGDRQTGFEDMVAALEPARLAKWSLVTLLPNHVYPDDEVFVKPTTAKGVIRFFELDGLDYRPRPGWAFYAEYVAQILAMKREVDASLSPNNAAFCGFLMITMRGPEAHG